MANIFMYSDNFRDYLKNYYEEKKQDNPKFSYRWLADKAGLDHRVLFDVINKGKHFSRANSLKLSKALNHSRNEEGYFINLVGYSQAKDDEERSNYQKEMMQFITTVNPESENIRKDQSAYLATWLHSAVRGVIGIFSFKDEYEMLTRMLSQPARHVSVEDVKHSVHLLERLGMIARDSGGIYRITRTNLATGKDITDADITRYHREFTKLAREALFYHSPGKCKAKSLTLAMSQQTHEHIWDETQKFISRIIELVSIDKNADRLYQYQFILFPLSNDEHGDEDHTRD